jgi:hypothetical protein
METKQVAAKSSDEVRFAVCRRLLYRVDDEFGNLKWPTSIL